MDGLLWKSLYKMDDLGMIWGVNTPIFGNTQLYQTTQ